MRADSVKRTLTITVLLCFACSLLVATSVVLLRPRQEANKSLDLQKNILQAAGLFTSQHRERDIDGLFSRVEERIVDLATGEMVSGEQVNWQEKVVLNPADDLAKIRERGRYQKIYLVRGEASTDDNGTVEKIILPVYGKGLWSTLYGMVAMAPDGETILGLTFYQHGETPGLGGEVDNPNWKKQWVGKKMDLAKGVSLVKGGVNLAAPGAIHQVDALSGATITSRGVENLINYWLGANGYGKLLAAWEKNHGI